VDSSSARSASDGKSDAMSFGKGFFKGFNLFATPTEKPSALNDFPQLLKFVLTDFALLRQRSFPDWFAAVNCQPFRHPPSPHFKFSDCKQRLAIGMVATSDLPPKPNCHLTYSLLAIHFRFRLGRSLALPFFPSHAPRPVTLSLPLARRFSQSCPSSPSTVLTLFAISSQAVQPSAICGNRVEGSAGFRCPSLSASLSCRRRE